GKFGKREEKRIVPSPQVERVICGANRREEKNRLLRPLRHAQRPWHYSLVTVPLMYPYGSSVAIKISLLFSMPNCSRLKGMWCLLGIFKRISFIALNLFSTSSPIEYKVC